MAGCHLNNYREDEECPGRVTIEEDGSEEWAVQRIISKRKEDGIWKYEIKWHGWPNKYNTWEPALNLTHCQEKLDAFEREWKKKQRKASSKKSSLKSGEPERIKTEQGGSEKATVAGTSGQLDVNVEESTKNNSAENEEEEEEEEEPLCGFREEISELDKMWLGTYYKNFRREWKSTEEPICVLASAVVHDALLHMVRIRCPNDPENIMDNPEEGITNDNSVLVLSTMFRKKFPQILIAYYQSRLTMMDQLKSDENLLRDAARAGLVHNLLGAKVDAKYRTIYKDMMPPGQNDESDDESHDHVPDKKYKGKEGQKKKVGIKESKDEYGLPYYYNGEDEGTFGSDDEGNSDDSEDWEEVKGKGKSNRLPKKEKCDGKA